MKICWDENPLNTKIELEDHEKKELWYKIKIEQMVWLLFEANCYLGMPDKDGRISFERDLEKVFKKTNPDYYITDDEKSELDKRVDLIFDEYIEALAGPHCGDCVSVACTCDKCMAEELLGINTIKGLGQASAHDIFDAFGETPENNWTKQRTIDEAIQWLENYQPENPAKWKWLPAWKEWEPHVARWGVEAKAACEWLKSYKNQHFSNS